MGSCILKLSIYPSIFRSAKIVYFGSRTSEKSIILVNSGHIKTNACARFPRIDFWWAFRPANPNLPSTNAFLPLNFQGCKNCLLLVQNFRKKLKTHNSGHIKANSSARLSSIGSWSEFRTAKSQSAFKIALSFQGCKKNQNVYNLLRFDSKAARV